jgi:hypothetical protein
METVDIFQAPPPKRQRAPFSLATIAKRPLQDSAQVKRIKGALDPEVAKGLTSAYSRLENPIYVDTYWERVARVLGWLELPEAIAARDQFGDQEERPKAERHKVRWRLFTRDHARLIGALAQWQDEHKGGYRGWLPVPGEREWAEAVQDIAGATGIYLYIGDKRQHGHEVATSGLCVMVQGDDASCICPDT